MELPAVELVAVEVRLLGVAGILGPDGIGIEDRIELLDDVILVLVVFVAEVQFVLLFVGVITGRELSLLVDVAFHAKGEGQFLRVVFVELFLLATCVGDHHAKEELLVHLDRAVAHGIGNLCL